MSDLTPLWQRVLSIAEWFTDQTEFNLQLFYVVFAFYLWSKAEGRSRFATIIALLMLPLLLLCLITLLSMILVTMDRMRGPAVTTLMSPNVLWVGCATAIALFWLRGRLPVIYGLLEVAVGIGSLGLAAYSPQLTAAGQLLAVAAGVYVIIRGLDNIGRGLRGRAKRAWQRVFKSALPENSPGTIDKGVNKPRSDESEGDDNTKT